MEFLHFTEKLKTEFRRTYKSNGTHETVAEHSWRLCLMTSLFSGTIDGIDGNKCLKMALVHDLPEIFAGDAYRLDVKEQIGLHEKEAAALETLVTLLPKDTGEEITGLWLEFEDGKTAEARLVRLLDRLEVLVQHNESQVSKWSDIEKQIQYGLAEKHAGRYGFLHEFALEIDKETAKKLADAGYTPEKLDKETYDKYYGG
jgi:putative hydrolases of HD superfamily